jgi:integrase
MVNAKVLLDTRRAKSDGSFNVIIRITDYNKVYTINSGISVPEKLWNQQKSEVDKSHPNAKLINLKLSKTYFQVQQAILKYEDNFSIEAIRNFIDGKPELQKTLNFKTFTDNLINEMFETEKTGNALVYTTASNRFLEFCNNPSIRFDEIDYLVLEKFNHFLVLEGLKQNSISNYFRTLRAIYNKAIKAKIIERSAYPFHDITIKPEKTTKRAILKEDISKFINYASNENSPCNIALKYFLLSYYLIGISFTDLAYLTKENIVDGRIVYRRRKTKKNYSVKIFPQAQTILSHFHSDDKDYLLPILPKDIPCNGKKAKKMIQQWIKTTNKHLNKLAEKLEIKGTITTYVARHTFATNAKRLGYSYELIAEALGHEFGNKITNIYLDSFDKEIIDSMHQKVIES